MIDRSDAGPGARETLAPSPSWPVIGHPYDAETFGRLLHPGTVEGLRALLADVGVLDSDLQRAAQRGHTPQALELCVSKFQTRRFRYGTEPWQPQSPQRIRDLRWVAEECGTCIDYAMALSSLLYYCAGLVPEYELNRRGALHPFLLLNQWKGAGIGHAVVVTPLNMRAYSSLRRMFRNGTRTATLDAHELDLLRDDDIKVIDLARSVEKSHTSPSSAYASGLEHLAGSSGWSSNDFIDLAASAEFLAKTQRSAVFWDAAQAVRPSLSARLPLRPDYVPVPSRTELLASLVSRSGLSALSGLSGSGKSMLALAIARAADGGHGWFLNASSINVLIAELADAELRESGGRVTASDGADHRESARMALKRLREARTPWVVILDNAEADILATSEWIPKPNPSLGQHVVITTTLSPDSLPFDSFWLPPLKPEDLPPIIVADQRLVDACNGSALSAFTVAQFMKWSGMSAPELLAHLGAPVAEGPDIIPAVWEAFKSKRPQDPGAIETARRLAWLPPEHLDVSFDDLPHRCRQVLLEAAIVRHDGVSTAMHRKMSAAIRADEPAGASRERVVRLLVDPAVRKVMDSHGDSSTFQHFAEALAGPGEDTTVHVEAVMTLAALYELFGQTRDSAGTYRRAEELLAAGEGYPAERLLTECRFGQARYVNQRGKDPAEILGWIDRLDTSVRYWREQAAAPRATPEDVVTFHRFSAMQALLQIKVVSTTWNAAVASQLRGYVAGVAAAEPGAEPLIDALWARPILMKAQRTLSESGSERRRILGPHDPETARAVFNLGRAHVWLAKFADPSERLEHLRLAERAYAEALVIRKEIYLRDYHPHIAACQAGLGLVHYEQACHWLQQPGRSGDMQSTVWELLRTASNDVHDSLIARQALDGPIDDDDTEKSARLMLKIMAARLVARPKRIEAVPELLLELRRELGFGRDA